MNRKKILIADDNELHRKILASAISTRGNFQIIEISSCKQCLEVINEISINLMFIGGFDNEKLAVIHQIRQKFNLIQLPISVMLSNADESRKLDYATLGINDCICDFLNYGLILPRISMYLNLIEIFDEMLRTKVKDSLDAIIATYHDEIINPLSIAIYDLENSEISNPVHKERIAKSLWQINDAVKDIQTMSTKQLPLIKKMG